MREYQQKHIARKMLYSKMTIFVLAIVCMLMFRSVMELYGKYKKVSILEEKALEEKNNLEQKVNKARSKSEALHTERGIETYVRTTYPVVKQDEGVIIVYDASSSPVVSVRKEVSFFDKVQSMMMEWFR